MYIIPGSSAHGAGNEERRTLRAVIRPSSQVSDVSCLRAAAVTDANGRSQTNLVVGYASGAVSVYSCSTYRELWSARAHDVDASVIELHIVEEGDGHIMLTQSRTGEVVRWEIDWVGRRFVRTGRLDRADPTVIPELNPKGENDIDIEETTYSFARMCCVPEHGVVAYPSKGNSVTVHRYETSARVVLDTRTGGLVTALSGTMGVDGALLVCVGYESGLVEVYDVRMEDGGGDGDGDGETSPSGRVVYSVEAPGTDPCVALDCCLVRTSLGEVRIARGFAGDGTADVGGSEIGQLPSRNPPLVHLGALTAASERVEDRESLDSNISYVYQHTASVMETPKGMMATLRGMDQVIFRKDGKYVAVACWDGKVRIYRASTGKLVDVIVHHTQASTSFAFVDTGRDGALLVVGSRDGTCSLFSLRSPVSIRGMNEHEITR